MHRKKVAIVGSGCSGIGALWALQTTDHEVHLYEAKDRLGGHTNTVTFKNGNNETPVDTGFIVMNSATYPNFIAFLKQLSVQTVATQMTFGVSRDRGLFEWSGTSLSSIFAQTENVFRLGMWRLLFDVIRFNQFSLDLLAVEDEIEVIQNDSSKGPSRDQRLQESIGEYLEREGYSEVFKDDYLIPMTAAVWSTSPDKCFLEFPAVTLIRFLWNHHLLSTLAARPDWLTIPAGSRTYIDAVLQDFPKERIHLDTPVLSIWNDDDGRVVLQTRQHETEVYDHVVLACHGDQVLDIVRDQATLEETDILSKFETSRNEAVLHTDTSLMPQRSVTWSAWNYLTQSTADAKNVDKICLTYWMNLLQHIPSDVFGPVLVTLNPLHEPDPKLTHGRWTYHHPLYNAAAIRSQKLLANIQNTRHISYAGAWTKYGFHEDGFSSGLKVATEHLSAKLPFEFLDSTFSRGNRPELEWKDHCVRLAITILHFWISLFAEVIGMPSRALQRQRQKKLV
ncbi:MAG: hypothetical protein M1833_004132 [Piccolia ochrophora]|nr:MAG: hypothetical protein M1833_004132 [Piccolia ochrophora]